MGDIKRSASKAMRAPHRREDAYLISINEPFSDTLARQATTFARQLAADPHSADNPIRMFADPALRPRPQSVYVLYGGNGGIIPLIRRLENDFPRTASSVGAGRMTTGTYREESHRGILWLCSTFEDTISVKRLGTLRHAAVEKEPSGPHATLIITSSSRGLIGLEGEADHGLALVQLRDRDGFTPYEDRFLGFLRKQGTAPFLMASCSLWEKQGSAPWYDICLKEPH